MQLTVSLTDEDVATLDEYVCAAGLPSRTAAVQAAIGLLRDAHLEEDYVHASQEWSVDDEGAWAAVARDGLRGRPRGARATAPR